MREDLRARAGHGRELADLDAIGTVHVVTRGQRGVPAHDERRVAGGFFREVPGIAGGETGDPVEIADRGALAQIQAHAFHDIEMPDARPRAHLQRGAANERVSDARTLAERIAAQHAKQPASQGPRKNERHRGDDERAARTRAAWRGHEVHRPISTTLRLSSMASRDATPDRLREPGAPEAAKVMRRRA